ncbi:unannotated protein [freshwater metagenome]|uniref:Unannotated protein n=1 Tax=freshwater metagenome TaxID=449393 RepID=A0A6J7GED4_9ZZZZ
MLNDTDYSRINALAWVASSLPDSSDRVLINAPASDSLGAWLIPALFPLNGSGSVVMSNAVDTSAIAQQEGISQVWQ